MAFQDRAQGLCSRLHLTAVRRPVFIGVGVLLGLVLVAAGLLLAFPHESTFEIYAADQAQSSSEVAAGSAAADDGGEVPVDAGEAQVASAPSDTALPAADVPEKLCVHVDGKVASPGVYYLDAGSRVVDAVEAAGGLAEGACTAAVNLAEGLQDGEQIVIPDAETASSVAASAGGASGASSQEDPSAAGLVNINTADAAALETLNGVGEATAEKIIADREANGPFKSLEDLKRVSGIGDKKFEALRDAICL